LRDGASAIFKSVRIPSAPDATDVSVMKTRVKTHNFTEDYEMIRKTLALGVAVISLCIASSATFASPTCTKEPEAKWLSEAAMKQKISDMGYKNIKVFKKTNTGCYEIYGYAADGHKAEVYFNPVNGEIVENNVD
jgi:hypothetical protein